MIVAVVVVVVSGAGGEGKKGLQPWRRIRGGGCWQQRRLQHGGRRGG